MSEGISYRFGLGKPIKRRSKKKKFCRVCKKRRIYKKPSYTPGFKTPDDPFWDVCGPCEQAYYRAVAERDRQRAEDDDGMTEYGY